MKTFEELERTAYIAGNAELAQAYKRIAELWLQVENLKNASDDVVTLECWEQYYGPVKEYYQFFNDCFTRLNGHYPCPYPDITSDYDKSIIFAAIERGELARAEEDAE